MFCVNKVQMLDVIYSSNINSAYKLVNGSRIGSRFLFIPMRTYMFIGRNGGGSSRVKSSNK